MALHKGTHSVYAKRIDRDYEPGIVPWAKILGIWGKNARTDGYEVQTKNKGGKWAPVELAGARRAEIGRIPKAKPGTFKVRVR